MWGVTLRFKLQHQPDGVLIELADTRLFQVRIVVAYLADNALKHAVELHALDIHHHAIGIGQTQTVYISVQR
jgi:hypothetical protein